MEKTIGIYLWQNMTMLDVLGPHQFLGFVPAFKVVTCAKTKDPVVTDTGLRLIPDHDFTTCPPFDVLLVGGGANLLPPDNVVERSTATAELLELAKSLEDPVLASRALMLRFRAAMEVADIAEAVRCLAKNQAIVADLGQPTLAWSVMLQHAGLVLLRGNITAAEREIHAAYQHGVASGQHEAYTFSLALRFWLRFEQGRLIEVEEDYRRLLERIQTPGIKAMYGTLLAETNIYKKPPVSLKRWPPPTSPRPPTMSCGYDSPPSVPFSAPVSGTRLTPPNYGPCLSLTVTSLW